MEENFSNKDLMLMSEISKGRTYKEVARIMNVSPRTIEWRIRKIFSHTGCRNKVEVANYFREKISSPKTITIERLVEYLQKAVQRTID